MRKPNHNCPLTVVFLALALLICSTKANTQSSTIFLLRHGETVFPPYQENPPNPHLNDAGLERARLLAKMLRSEQIDHIFSTDYRRTQQTIAPLSEAKNIPITVYNGRKLEDLARKIKGLRGNIVVCGHSNTTGEMVQLLGGRPGEKIDRQTEFDRLYVLHQLPNGQTHTVLLRYGASYQRQTATATVQRKIAITIDDLPAVTLDKSNANYQDITDKLLSTLEKTQVPAIGFVNENKLYRNNRLDPVRLDLLRDWLASGMELGNHGFAHKDYHRVSFREFAEDIKKGEKYTNVVLKEQGQQLKYFRHPFLHTGNSSDKQLQLTKFLKDNNYVVAPVTIDNAEYIFARAYELALQSADQELMEKIGNAYIPYMEQKTAYFESQSRMLFNREISQTLLIHANALNGDYLDELLQMYQRRGYQFVSLEEALKDPAYKSPDRFTGDGGITWLHRWAITKGVDRSFYKGEPTCPEFVQNAANIRE